MRASTHKKLSSIGTTTPFTEPHQSYEKTPTGASNVRVGGTIKPAGEALGHPSAKNLGKYLHPKKSGYTPNSGKPAAQLNSTVDANTGGAKVRATQ